MTFDGDIHVFRTFPHMHSYGKELWTTLYDDVANTSKVISYKQFWNFHFQDTLMELNVTIKPNDWLSTHCVYDVSSPFLFHSLLGTDMSIFPIGS